MRYISIIIALLASLTASAQLVTVTGIEQVRTPLRISQATVSPDGKYVVATTYDDGALWQVPLNAPSKARKIADDGTLYTLQFTPDSQGVVYVRALSDSNRLRYKEVRYVDLQTLDTQLLHPATRTYNGVGVSGDAAVVVDNKQPHRHHLPGDISAPKRPVASIHFGQLILTRDGKTVALNPNGKEGCSYLWPSVSPDGTKVLYYLGGTGAFVCNLDGSNVIALGELRAPCWVDDNTVVGMRDRDMGRTIISSPLIAVSLDGKSQTLTPKGMIAMYPTVSADGKTITFSTPDGKLYKLKVK